MLKDSIFNDSEENWSDQKSLADDGDFKDSVKMPACEKGSFNVKSRETEVTDLKDHEEKICLHG